MVPWYDKAFGFVVRAETEASARYMASKQGGDETSRNLLDEPDEPDESNGVTPWLDPALSTCEELTPDGPAVVILRDLREA